MSKFYVYEIIDPRNGETFYVGKGKGDRLKRHLTPSYLKLNHPKSERIREIVDEGFDPLFVKVEEGLDEYEAFRLEKRTIDKIGLENLTNKVCGGIGYSLSDEHKEKISKTLRGRKLTDEHRKNLSISHKGQRPWMTGRKHREETKEKMREARQHQNPPMLGKKHSEKTKEKISKAHRGKKLSEDHKRKKSESMKLWWKKRKMGEI
jgi:hypothetical protein